jgi:hypothetical protein
MKNIILFLFIGFFIWGVSRWYKMDQEKLAKIYPFVHQSCKELHDQEDYSLVCFACKKQYNEWASIEGGKIMKKWKEVKGYEFGKGDFLCDVNEMCQIFVNRKLHLYQEKK